MNQLEQSLLPEDAIEGQGSIVDDEFEPSQEYYIKLVERVFENEAFIIDSTEKQVRSSSF